MRSALGAAAAGNVARRSRARALSAWAGRGSGESSKGDQVRERFLKYFEDEFGHERVGSAALVPRESDATLLFTNAGMVQFKEVLLGNELRPYSRATSVQKCVRAGGKHNDLDNVGRTPRHHTFFEMLGNFSFGDYLKEEAILMAWRFVHRELGIPADRLRVTVFDQDVESEALWKKVLGGTSVPIHRLGKADNFWSMGDGPGVPCGPCSEIFFDTQSGDGDERYLEIWNLVFMQFASDGAGGLTPLPRPCVDTGMGLERICSVLQGVGSNFETDLLAPLVEGAAEAVRAQQRAPGLTAHADVTLLQSGLVQRVVADHLRAAAFLVADGVVPSNVGRGYVLRRLIRRAASFAFRAGARDPFMSSLLPIIETIFAGSPYTELHERRLSIAAVVAAEEALFFRTVDQGMHVLERELERIGSGEAVPGQTAFKLYDTFGFPVDLTEAVAEARGLRVDLVGFEAEMARQRERSGATLALGGMHVGGASKEGSAGGLGRLPIPSEVRAWAKEGHSVLFSGYNSVREPSTVVLAASAVEDGRQWACISPCPFYAEGGGQIGDSGTLTSGDAVWPVLDARRPFDGGIALLLDVSEAPPLGVGQVVGAAVDVASRNGCEVHHTATHLLHAALRSVLGDQVAQAGSFVSSSRLRFDFAHPRPLSKDEVRQYFHLRVWPTKEQVLQSNAEPPPLAGETHSASALAASDTIRFFAALPGSACAQHANTLLVNLRPCTTTKISRIEACVNAFALENVPIQTEEMTIEQAKARNATMLFGEKYDSVVRVVSALAPEGSVPEVSKSVELCGGTHAASTGKVFPFKIVSEGSVAAGTRRIEAVASSAAREWFEKRSAALEDIAAALRQSAGDPGAVVDGVQKVLDREQAARRECDKLRAEILKSAPAAPAAECGVVAIHLVPELAPGEEKKTLKLLQERGNSLAQSDPDRVHVLLCGSKRVVLCTGRADAHAGRLLRCCFEELERIAGGDPNAGGKGGGGEALAQGQFAREAPKDLGLLANAVLAAISKPV